MIRESDRTGDLSMDFKSFYQGLAVADRARFAEIAGTTTGYIEVHLVTRRKIPKPRLIASLAKACAQLGGAITEPDLLSFFYRMAEQSEARGRSTSEEGAEHLPPRVI
jgi:hypothetical protein